MATIPDTLVPVRDGDVLLITTKEGVWGKGPTIQAAKKNLKIAGGNLKTKGWRVRSTDRDSYVDGFGNVYHMELAHPPYIIAESGMAVPVAE